MALYNTNLKKIKNETIILYEDIDGSTTDIILKDNTNNCSAIEIIYGCDGFYFSTGKIYEPYEKNICLYTPYAAINGADRLYLYVSNWQVQNEKIAFLTASNRYLTESNTVGTFGTNSYIRIYKVIGYK